MKLSVALCTCEGASYLSEQLDSIATQSRQPDEVVVFDDRSTDDTMRILEAFASRVPFRVAVAVNGERLGPMRNFEQAIRHCTGDVIVLADQDDVWRQQKLARLEETFRAMPGAGLVFTDAAVVDEHGRTVGYRAWESAKFGKREQRMFLKGAAFKCLLERPIVTGATMAFRARFVPLVVPFPEPERLGGFIHDAWIALAISAVADVAFIDDVLVDYRRHSAQQVGLRVLHELSADEPNADARGGNLRRRIFGSRRERRRFLKRSLDRLKTVRSVLYDRGAEFSSSRLSRKLAAWDRHLCAREAVLERGGLLSATVKELLSLRYHRLSNGLMSAAADLLAPES